MPAIAVGGGAGGYGSTNLRRSGRGIGSAPPQPPRPAPQQAAYQNPGTFQLGTNMPGGSPGGSPAPYDFSSSVASGPAPELTNVFDATMGGMGADDPFVNEMIANYRRQMSTDNTEQAITGANMKVDEQLAGAQQRITEAGARSGDTGGTAAATQAAGETSQRLKAGNAAQIKLQRQQDLDRLVGMGESILGLPGRRRLQYLQQAGSLAGSMASDRRQGADQSMELMRTNANIAQQQGDAYRQWFQTIW